MSTKPTFTYTLVAYRANGTDSCRGCLMGQSNSDFSLSVYTDAGALAKDWASMQFNAPHGREFCPTEYTLLLNGLDQDHDPWEGDEGVELDPETGETWFYLERQRVDALVEHELAALTDAKRLAQERQAQAEEARLAAKRQAEATAREERDRQEYARLSALFGDKA